MTYLFSFECPYLATVTPDCVSSTTTRLRPLQVTAINSSMSAVSWVPTSRWKPLNRTWWHGTPGSLNTPYQSPLPTQCVQRCFVWWWILRSSSFTVFLFSLAQSAEKRNMVKVRRRHQPRSVMLLNLWLHKTGTRDTQTWRVLYGLY